MCTSDKGTAVLTGVTSWGLGCAEEGKPGVYSDVFHATGWIRSVVNDNFAKLINTTVIDQ